MTTEKRVPALKTTMKPLVAQERNESDESKSNPESATDSLGEGAETVVPPAEEEIAESPEGEESPAEGAESQDNDKDKPAEVEEYEIFLEGEEDDDPAPKDNAAWAKIRTDKAKAEAEAARLKRELEAAKAPAGVPDPGPEPTEEDCAYDMVEFKKRIREWDAKKAAFDAHKVQKAEQEQAQQRELQSQINSYNTAMTELSKRIPGCAEAEKVVAANLSEDRKLVILKYADNPARVVSFLGRSPERLEEFAKETDLGRFVAKLAKLEVGMKERKKTQAPPPERNPRGSGAVNSADSTLEKLRREAERTGDYKKVNAYKRDQKRKREAARQ